MRIVTNSTATEGHFPQLAGLVERATSMTLMSPFLASDMKELLGGFDLTQLRDLHVITTLKPRTKEQFRKLDAIVSLMDLAQALGHVNLRVSINNRLHGKVYIFRHSARVFAAVITSANFTESGLHKNREWGVLIEDTDTLTTLESTIADATDYLDLSVDDALVMLEALDDYRQKHGEPTPSENIELNLNEVMESRGKPLAEEISSAIWLKPIGVSDDPIIEGTDFSASPDELHFSKRRPAGVAIGDTMIAYGVGTGLVLTYYTVASEPERIPDTEMTEAWMERWPWFVIGTNNAINFGREWWTHGLHINGLVNEFLAEAGGEATITAAGGSTLGALNFGADKVRLSRGFGAFIIRKVRSTVS